ncbi:glycoside hydrolase superfamily [Amylocarpus encephaloides]|uniref:Glycoside hydrolase superfamily n=1 Tax=Amylocarpus encephaloides TaxID=45428 RepID=A0A9P7Y800_9HELO|nr:glycoside hydrolase superfamily [Amylocarpus encephaloides]
MVLEIPPRPLQPYPLSRDGRWIADAKGAHVPLVGVNWPAHLDTMLPEGLRYQSIPDIVQKISDTGFNFARLTFAVEMVDDVLDRGGDVKIQDALARALGSENGERVLRMVFDAVAVELAARSIYLHLDNHVSKGYWCCSLTDGNSWFGDTFFDTTKWTRALAYMAAHFKKGRTNWGTFTSIGLRNELRPATTSVSMLLCYKWSTYQTYMTAAASAIYAANPSLLIFFSGLESVFNVAPLVAGTTLLDPGFKLDVSTYECKNKFVLELYEYDENISGICPIYKGILNTFGGDATTRTIGNAPAPLVISEWGGSMANPNVWNGPYVRCLAEFMIERGLGWAVWVVAGSYYVREGTQDYDESYGLLDHTWSGYRGTRSNEVIKKLIADTYKYYGQ